RLRARREPALLRLTGATTRQVLSMARWEAILIITIGLGLGLAIAATALLPLSHALTGGLRPYAPAGWLAAILGVSALLALVALSVPTRRAPRARPGGGVGVRGEMGGGAPPGAGGSWWTKPTCWPAAAGGAPAPPRRAR